MTRCSCSFFILVGLIAGCSFSASGQEPAGARNFDIRDFGAVADTTRLSTAAMNAASGACSRGGGGRVIIPAGHFKSGTITLLDNVELSLERGAVLYGSTNPDDYPRQR